MTETDKKLLWGLGAFAILVVILVRYTHRFAIWIKEKRALERQVRITKVQSRLNAHFPSFDLAGPSPSDIAAALGLDMPHTQDALLKLERIITSNEKIRKRLENLNRLIRSCQPFCEQIEAMSRYVSIQLTHRWNPLQHPLSNPDRGHHRVQLRRELAILKPLEDQFASDRSLFRKEIKALLQEAVLGIFGDDQDETDFAARWISLMEATPFASLAERASKVGLLTL